MINLPKRKRFIVTENVGTQSILLRILFGALGQYIANRNANYCCTILEKKANFYQYFYAYNIN